MYVIVASNHFIRQARKFFRNHPDLRTKFAAVVDDLRTDPFQPRLGLHSLGGKLKDLQAVRLTHSYRITLTIMVTEKEIILLDIGSHDKVYR
ncbi:MAG TPA: type II toxin-antitoxin system mRNA interferase toxin, RelE/StbE family [Dissulfurispiraceae bacterium]|nr:type II toxin-antitoxin system mRNA interferase toxin, RelE/StbE family [Dissulfurispiraceae bacterium]